MDKDSSSDLDDLDEFDEYQHEISTELANNFIESKLMPLLEEFDFNNSDEDYIPGIATFTLFARLAVEMLAEGYTSAEISAIIDDFAVNIADSTLH